MLQKARLIDSDNINFEIIDFRPSLSKYVIRQSSPQNSLIGFSFLFALSKIYHLATSLRNTAFRKKFIKVKKAPCKVISIGNIAVGGTGKTPFACFLAQKLKDEGLKVAILSRGYGRSGSLKICLVSDGEKILSSARDSGDEPYMISQKLDGVPVIVGKNRYQCSLFAKKKFDIDIVILDDGFQHQYIHRNINLLVINANNPFGNGQLLPCGILREPIENIKRANLILINKIQNNLPLDPIYNTIKKYNPNVAIFKATYVPKLLIPLDNEGKNQKIDFLKGKNVLAFSGIGDPQSFIRCLKNEGINIKTHLIFSDHHWFSKKDIETIIRHASEADCIITTDKDRIKIKKYLHLFPMPIFALSMGLNIIDGVEKLKKICLGLLYHQK